MPLCYPLRITVKRVYYLIRTTELHLIVLFKLNYVPNWTAVTNRTLNFSEYSAVYTEMLKKGFVFYKDARTRDVQICVFYKIIKK